MRYLDSPTCTSTRRFQVIAFELYRNYHRAIMTADEFRRIALKFPGAIESAHMGHPDFRANGKIFATLHAGDMTGMIKLPPELQQDLVAADPATFSPVNGAWGRQGCTVVTLEPANEDQIGEAMTLAWQNTSKPLSRSNAKPQPAKKSAKRPRKSAKR
jgi:hypothetical protein